MVAAPVPGNEQQHGIGHAVAFERPGIVIHARLRVSGHLYQNVPFLEPELLGGTAGPHAVKDCTATDTLRFPP